MLQRHRICPYHVSLPEMMNNNGDPVRFCQQCGRFQPLDEFDGTKKSCRLKLLLHNEQRRRKRARHRQLDSPRLTEEENVDEKPSLSPSSNHSSQPAVVADPSAVCYCESPKNPALCVCNGNTPSHEISTLPKDIFAELRIPEDFATELNIDDWLCNLESEGNANSGTEIQVPPAQHVQQMAAPRAVPVPAFAAAPTFALGVNNASAMPGSVTMVALPRMAPAQNSNYSTAMAANLNAQQALMIGMLPTNIHVSVAPRSLQYEAPQRLVSNEEIANMSHRLFKAAPNQLPTDVLTALITMLQRQVSSRECDMLCDGNFALSIYSPRD